ncbi:MAG: GNAT family protein [Bacteroidales bacterium]|nr:GNAT family protein [Bacteroidales bacterium]
MFSSGIIIDEKIVLRAIEPTDLDFLYRLENDSNYWLSSDNREPRSRYTLKRYISQCVGDFFTRGELQLIIADRQTNEQIGYVELFNLSNHHKRAEVGVIVAPKWQHQGIASRVLTVWGDYAIKKIGLHKIVALTDVENMSAQKAFTHANFQVDATLKNWIWCDGSWHDVVLLSLDSESVGTFPER